VPALIVSPWVEPGSVSHTVFDHTTIIKTILLRFCPEQLTKPKRDQGLTARVRNVGQPRSMGTRVAQANDLGELLARTAPRPPPGRYALIEDAAVRAAARAEGTSSDHDVLPGRPETDLQRRIATANRELRRLGHPPDRP
jgi:phospholipase C